MCQVWKAMDEIYRKDAILYSPAQVKIKGILPPKSQHGKLFIIIIIIIKCMCSRCRRDDIHVCFAYASPQRMPHMYNHKRVSLKYIK